jgi:hypothetical protein
MSRFYRFLPYDIELRAYEVSVLSTAHIDDGQLRAAVGFDRYLDCSMVLDPTIGSISHLMDMKSVLPHMPNGLDDTAFNPALVSISCLRLKNIRPIERWDDSIDQLIKRLDSLVADKENLTNIVRELHDFINGDYYPFNRNFAIFDVKDFIMAFISRLSQEEDEDRADTVECMYIMLIQRFLPIRSSKMMGIVSQWYHDYSDGHDADMLDVLTTSRLLRKVVLRLSTILPHTNDLHQWFVAYDYSRHLQATQPNSVFPRCSEYLRVGLPDESINGILDKMAHEPIWWSRFSVRLNEIIVHERIVSDYVGTIQSLEPALGDTYNEQFAYENMGRPIPEIMGLHGRGLISMKILHALGDHTYDEMDMLLHMVIASIVAIYTHLDEKLMAVASNSDLLAAPNKAKYLIPQRNGKEAYHRIMCLLKADYHGLINERYWNADTLRRKVGLIPDAVLSDNIIMGDYFNNSLVNTPD